MKNGHRIFIAVPLHPPLLAAIGDLEHRLEAAGIRLRWIRPENLHLTLRFLGEISEEQVSQVRLAAREAVAGFDAFPVVLAGVGAFPNPHRPQVVWVGVREGAERLRALAERLDDRLALQDFPREPRAFRAHLTLARVREQRLGPDPGRAMALFEGEEVGRQQVNSLLVVESLLRPQGPFYVPVEEVRLLDHEK